MSNPLRKTMVYLGLADEEYDEYEQPAAPAAPAAPVAAAPRAAVTPIRRPERAARQHAPQAVSEIVTLHPRAYKDARAIAESFREGVPVIINISQMDEAEARRLIDFACGLSEGLYGKIERVTNKVFLLSPEHVAVSGESAEVDEPVEAGFYSA